MKLYKIYSDFSSDNYSYWTENLDDIKKTLETLKEDPYYQDEVGDNSYIEIRVIDSDDINSKEDEFDDFEGISKLYKCFEYKTVENQYTEDLKEFRKEYNLAPDTLLCDWREVN